MLPKKVFKSILLHKFLFALIAIIIVLFLANTLHEEYPDEYDSIVGGKYILEGKVPYRDWFQHHNPFAYYWAASLLIIAGKSFVTFRILLAVSYIALYGFTYLYMRRRFKNPVVDYVYLPVIVFIGFISTYFWFHMLLADTLAAHLLLPAFAFLVFLTLLKEKMTLKDFTFVTLLSFFSWFTSMTYIYVIVLLNLFAFYKLVDSNRNVKTVVKAILIGLLPYLGYFMLLAITGSIDDYYFANVTYNQYYIYNYPRAPGSAINPVRYAVVIFQSFANNYYPLLTQAKDMYFGDPFAVTFALSNFVFVLYLFRIRQFMLALLTLLVVIFSTARIDPRVLGETNYQASVYILLSSFTGIATLYLVSKWLNTKRLILTEKSIGLILFLLLVSYWTFSGLYAPLKMGQKYYEKYMGTAPYIYNRPEIAPIINDIVGEDEYAWVGPFEFKELYYLQSRSPSKYHWFLQHARSLPRYHEGMIHEFEEANPTLIVFKRHFAPWGGDASEFNYFFTDYLDKNYIRLFEINGIDPNYDYKWTFGNTQNFDIDGNFYIRRVGQEKMIDELIEKGYVERREKSKPVIEEIILEETEEEI